MMDPHHEDQRVTSSIVVVGSLNMDLTMRVARAPNGGETVPGLDFAMLPGGKGANQAIACARMGANVIMVGRVGIDANGDVLKASLAADGVDAREVKGLASTHTGVASIWVESDGQNRIVLAPGANGLLDPASVGRANTMIDMAGMLIVQLEIPLPAVQAAIGRAFAAHVPVLLNPSPAMPLPEALWTQVDILVLNEREAGIYAGLPVVDAQSASTAGTLLRARGPDRVLVTLGAQGVVAVDAAGARHTPARKVKAVDTTGAGDTFIGALAAALCEGQSLDEAVALGQAAGALCVTRRGAQTSIPYRRQLAPSTTS